MAIPKKREKPPIPRGRPFEKGNKAGVGHGRPKGDRSLKQEIRAGLAAMLDDDGLKDFIQRFKRQTKNTKSYSYRKLVDLIVAPDILEQIETQLERRKREDRDFVSFRIWKSCFDVQQQILLSAHKRIYMMAGRRAGKTEVNVRLMADAQATCQYEGGARILYVGKTITTGVEQVWNPLMKILGELGIQAVEKRRNEGFIQLADGGQVFIRGNATTEEREKLRGFKWDLAIVDEAQSQAQLKYLIEDILEPALVDRKGKLVVSGTGPRVRGTYWEELLWMGSHEALRVNWNLSQNPKIDDPTALDKLRQEKGLSENDPLFVREYLGKIAYDDDALVIRLTPANYFTDADLETWLKGIPVTDVRFVAGLDYGFVDADGFSIICYAQGRLERWLVHEYKARRTGVTELAEAVRTGIKYIQTHPLFAPLTEKKFLIYADTGGAGKKIGYDLATQYQLPVQDAYKVNKDLAIELLQDEARRGMLKVRAGGAFDEEARHTVFRRNEQDQLTREIDDETYHPDLMDAVTYSLRTVWWFSRKVPTNS